MYAPDGTDGDRVAALGECAEVVDQACAGRIRGIAHGFALLAHDGSAFQQTQGRNGKCGTVAVRVGHQCRLEHTVIVGGRGDQADCVGDGDGQQVEGIVGHGGVASKGIACGPGQAAPARTVVNVVAVACGGHEIALLVMRIFVREDVSRQGGQPVAEFLRVLRRPVRVVGHKVRRPFAPIGVAQDVFCEHQRLRTHQRSVVADLAEGEALEGRAIIIVERLPDDALPNRARLDRLPQVEEREAAVVEDLVGGGASHPIDHIALSIVPLGIGRHHLCCQVGVT
ncbi:MAG: hypothetical protein ACJ8DI_27960 [Ktedonobacteraceae bacterium]